MREECKKRKLQLYIGRSRCEGARLVGVIVYLYNITAAQPARVSFFLLIVLSISLAFIYELPSRHEYSETPDLLLVGRYVQR